MERHTNASRYVESGHCETVSLIAKHNGEYDCWERKQLARQAKYRKNGSKSKKCTLPSDSMTHAQWKKKNGEVVTVKMNRPMRSWKEFKRLQPQTAAEYLQNLNREYKASVRDIADMFHMSYNTVWSYIKSLGISLSHTAPRTSEETHRWLSFLAGEVSKTEAPMTIFEDIKPPDTKSAEPESTTAVTEVCPEKPAAPAMNFDGFTVCFSGSLDVNEISNSLRMMLRAGLSGALTITYRKEERVA